MLSAPRGYCSLYTSQRSQSQSRAVRKEGRRGSCIPFAQIRYLDSPQRRLHSLSCSCSRTWDQKGTRPRNEPTNYCGIDAFLSFNPYLEKVREEEKEKVARPTDDCVPIAAATAVV